MVSSHVGEPGNPSRCLLSPLSARVCPKGVVQLRRDVDVLNRKTVNVMLKRFAVVASSSNRSNRSSSNRSSNNCNPFRCLLSPLSARVARKGVVQGQLIFPLGDINLQAIHCSQRMWNAGLCDRRIMRNVSPLNHGRPFVCRHGTICKKGMPKDNPCYDNASNVTNGAILTRFCRGICS